MTVKPLASRQQALLACLGSANKVVMPHNKTEEGRKTQIAYKPVIQPVNYSAQAQYCCGGWKCAGLSAGFAPLSLTQAKNDVV